MAKFYAVRVGKVPGIYTTWAEASKQVNGFSGAIYKSFTTKKEAEAFMNPTVEIVILPCDKEIVYTDGSYKKSSPLCGFGFVHVKKDSYIEYYGHVPLQKCSNNIAELYAIKAALETVPGDIEIRSDSEYSINVLSGNYNAKANLELINNIKKIMKGRNISFVHIMAHQGNKFNEIADKLANMGRETKGEPVKNEKKI